MTADTKSLLLPLVTVYLLLLVGATSGADPVAEGKQKTAYDFYVRGSAAFHNGDYDQAIAAFRESVKLEPGYYFAQINLGVSLAKTRRFEEAIRVFTRCIEEKRGPGADRFAFCFNRALARKECGETTAAQRDLVTMRKLDPARAKALRDSTRYILMDAAYVDARNEADRDRFFNQHKTAILKEKVIVRKVAGAGKNTEEYEAMGLIAGTLQEVSGVLADYEKYPEFMPNVEKTTIRHSIDGVVIVDWELSLPMGYVKKYRLKCWAKREGNRIQRFWKKLPWPGLEADETIVDTYGQWTLEPFPGQTNQVLAYYRVYTHPGRVPLGTGWIVDILSRNSVPSIIRRTRERVHDLFDQ
ncbi:MAG: tetratricopeptide repeat protein [Planctomycetota bacterium]|jgi:tetratricopeptide (TPR) repeat protein